MFPLSLVISSGGFEGELVNATCGETNDVSATITIPAISLGQAGDVQLILLSANTLDAPNFPTPADDGWRPIYVGALGTPDYYSSSLTALGTSNIYAYWRHLSGSAQNFIITNINGTTAWQQLLIRGVDSDNFIYGLFNGANKTNTSDSRDSFNCAYGVEANEGDLFIAHLNQSQAIAADILPDIGDDVLDACRIEANNGTIEAVSAAVASRHYSKANNLFRHSTTLDESVWTMTNVTRSLNVQTTTRRENVRLTHSSAITARFMASCDVDLEAGKAYSFIAAWRFDSAGAGDVLAATYVKPSDSSEHGIAFFSVPGTQIGSEVAVANSSYHTNFNNAAGLTARVVEMRFIAPETGTYEFRISLPRGSDPTNLDNTLGNTGIFIGLHNIVLCELPSLYHTACYIETGADPVLPGESALIMPPAFRHPSNNSTMQGGILGMLWKNTGDKKPLCKLTNLGTFGQTFHDGFSLTTTRILQIPSTATDWHIGLHSSHCVHKYIAAGRKFYAEYEVDATGTGTLAAGISVMCGIRVRAYVSPTGATPGTDLGNQLGSYARTMNGTTTLNGSSEGVTCDVAVAGDIIGVGLDLDAGEINWYLNGTLERTQTIADQTYQLRMPWILAPGIQSANESANATLYTMNFRGPFGGRKPSGYVAWDHDNELT